MGDSPTGGGLTRRGALQAGGAAGAAALLPFGLLDKLGLRPDRPPNFPQAVALARRTYENWATSIRADGLWTCRPTSRQQVLDVVNWARQTGWTVRPVGAMHGWSPFVVTPQTTRDSKTVLLDLADLRGIQVVKGPPASVKVAAGTRLLHVLQALQDHGLGLASVPATGDPTIAGALAIGAHGAVVPPAGEAVPGDHTYGSLSNLVLDITAVVWDAVTGRYVLRTFQRTDPEAGALMVHLGRACITDVTLRAGKGTRIRCQSFTDITVDELFAPPGSGGRTFQSLMEATGRAEAIWFPFTDKPWMKTWTVAPSKPAASKTVSGPYNYLFSDNIPLAVARLADLLITGVDALAPLFGQTMFTVADAGLTATGTRDIWGHAKDVQLYIKASTLRYDEFGYAVVCARQDVQKVLHLFAQRHRQQLAAHQARGSFPVNGPVELRCTALDDPAHAGVPGARAPSLAATAPRPDRPEWDTAVWVNVLTFAGTRNAIGFYRDLERWMLQTFDSTWATLRPEWSKGWGFTSNARFADGHVLDTVLPGLVSAGRPAAEGWDAAHATLSALDPHRVLGNPFLERWR